MSDWDGMFHTPTSQVLSGAQGLKHFRHYLKQGNPFRILSQDLNPRISITTGKGCGAKICTTLAKSPPTCKVPAVPFWNIWSRKKAASTNENRYL